jgi:hypothetical protein
MLETWRHDDEIILITKPYAAAAACSIVDFLRSPQITQSHFFLSTCRAIEMVRCRVIESQHLNFNQIVR